MLGGALMALSAREEALRTARTLDDDLGRLRARAESMQASGHPKAVRSLRHHYIVLYSTPWVVVFPALMCAHTHLMPFSNVTCHCHIFYVRAP